MKVKVKVKIKNIITEKQINIMYKQLILQIILIFCNAVFACAEIAVLSISEAKLEKMSEEGKRGAKRLLSLTKEPARFLATIQVAITLSGFLGSAFAAENFSDPIVKWLLDLGLPVPEATLDAISVVFITIVLSFVTLVFGELVPKRLAMRKTESMAMALSGPVSVISKIFAPIVWLLTVSTNGILRLLGIDPAQTDEDVSEEEIRMLADVGAERGIIDEEENDIIQNVFKFDDLTVSEAMVHRTEVEMLSCDDGIEEWRQVIHRKVYDYYPIYKDTSDNIVGVLNVKKFLTMDTKDKEKVILEAVSRPCFISSYAKANEIFSYMKNEHIRFAVIVDEFGGTDGIITINDLVKCLLGELEVSGENIVKTDFGYKIDGSAELATAERKLKIEFDGDATTMNGWMIEKFGRIPELEESVEYEHYRFTVEEADEKGVRLVSVCDISEKDNDEKNEANETDEPKENRKEKDRK